MRQIRLLIKQTNKQNKKKEKQKRKHRHFKRSPNKFKGQYHDGRKMGNSRINDEN